MKSKRKLILVLLVCLAVVVSACTSCTPSTPSTKSNQPVPDESSTAPATPPPETVTPPNTHSGPSAGDVGQMLTYRTGGASSSRGYSVKYCFDWGDGSYTESEFLGSGMSVSKSHTWSSLGTYYIKVKAISDSGISSSWSGGKKVTIAEPAPVQHEEIVATLHNHQLSGGYWHYWTEYIQAGRQVCISWEADGAVSVYILTETQYEYFKVYGFTARYVGYDKACRGRLCKKLANTDTYYLIIKNSSLFETFKVYSAEVKVTWWS